jgi:hypothetical protein
LVTDNGSNIIKAVRLLQDAGQDNIPAGSDDDSDSSSEDEEEENQLGYPMDLGTAVQREEEEFESREAQLQKEVVENMGKNRGKCFRYLCLVKKAVSKVFQILNISLGSFYADPDPVFLKTLAPDARLNFLSTNYGKDFEYLSLIC